MEPTEPIPPLTFIVLNTPEDVAKRRSTIASYAATLSWQQRQAGKPIGAPMKKAQAFHSWRAGMVPAKQRRHNGQSEDKGAVVHTASSGCLRSLHEVPPTSLIRSPRATHVGPYRHDPFASYPIKATSAVQHTVDFLLQKWAHDIPTIYASPKFKNEQLELCFPFALQNATVFHALIAAVRVALVLNEGRAPASDNAFLFHRGSALAKLRAKVSQFRNFTGDEDLAAISTLLFVDYQIGDWSSVIVHWNALKHMEKQWGALESGSDVEQHHRRCMVGYEGIVAHGKAMLAKDAASRATENIEVEYPKQPLPPQLRAIISRTPKGFANLASEGAISVEVIKLLALMSASLGYGPNREEPARTTKASPETVPRITNAANHLSGLPLQPLERKIAFGLLAYNWTAHVTEKLSATYRSVVQDAVDSLAFQGKIKAEEAELNCIVWLSFAIAGAGYQCEPPCSNTDAVLDLIVNMETGRDWEKLEKVLRLFFWDEPLGEIWKGHWEAAMARLS